MGIKIRCSQCKFLKKGEGIESFVGPQGIPTTVHRGRYYCKADISQRFTDEQIRELKECSYFRPRILTFQQEAKQKIILFLKQILSKIWEFWKLIYNLISSTIGK